MLAIYIISVSVCDLYDPQNTFVCVICYDPQETEVGAGLREAK